MTSHAALKLSPEFLEAFAAASGDRGSVHTDDEYSRTTRFRRLIIHGMMPVALVFLKFVPEAINLNYRVRKFSARFLSPAFIDDEVTIGVSRTEGSDEAVRYDFTVKDRRGVALVTSGFVEFAKDVRKPREINPEAALFPAALEQSCREIESISQGLSETLTFLPSSACLDKLSDLAARNSTPPLLDSRLQDLDPAAVALLPVSTMVGMRLPGRYGTCVEINGDFSSPVMPDAEVSLVAAVNRVSAASNRVDLNLSWLQNGIEIGKGRAATLVHERAPVPIGAAEIRARHLDHGITDKVALVTGASQGIGAATAKLLALHGAYVIVHYNRGASDAANVVKDILDNGGKAIALKADLGNETSIAQLFSEIAEKAGGVDILVNNAISELPVKAFHQLAAGDFLDGFNVSLLGLHGCIQRAIPHMKTRGWGRIINISTIATELPRQDQAAYATIKSALVGYTRSLAAELARDNITANLVLPRMTDTSLNFGMTQGMLRKIAEDSPTGRLLQPIDVAKAVFLLASDMAGQSSGQRLVLNQGEAPFL